MAKKGDWVQIHNIVLTPEERSSALPEDTKSHPLEMWVKGYLQQDEAQVGDEVEVITRTGRHATGKLVNEAPYFEHNFGFLIPEVTNDERQQLCGNYGAKERNHSQLRRHGLRKF